MTIHHRRCVESPRWSTNGEGKVEDVLAAAGVVMVPEEGVGWAAEVVSEENEIGEKSDALGAVEDVLLEVGVGDAGVLVVVGRAMGVSSEEVSMEGDVTGKKFVCLRTSLVILGVAVAAGDNCWLSA